MSLAPDNQFVLDQHRITDSRKSIVKMKQSFLRRIHQFGFRPTGSTTAPLIFVTHNITEMLERCTYVRCLVVDFSKAFDVVDHTVLLSKLARLDLPAHAINWIILFLTNRNQLVKVYFLLSRQSIWNCSFASRYYSAPRLTISEKIEEELTSQSPYFTGWLKIKYPRRETAISYRPFYFLL